MKEFSGKVAVITGGGTGMGRELAQLLVGDGCHVAICDVMEENMSATRRLCESAAKRGARISTHLVDVSVESQVQRFRDEVVRDMQTDRIHLLFNNAGVSGGSSLFTDDRQSWERTFNICWYGVYYNVRAFLPLLQKADEAHLINTSSINGFWASVGPGIPHTAYCAAKFAVKGFTEALMIDFATNAPHIRCSVVMPGHIGTQVMSNSRKILEGVTSDKLTPSELVRLRQRFSQPSAGQEVLSDEKLQAVNDEAIRLMVESAPTSAKRGAQIILEGVRANRWRILLGEDAESLDAAVRAAPENAYTEDFFLQYAPAIARLGHTKRV